MSKLVWQLSKIFLQLVDRYELTILSDNSWFEAARI